MISHVLLAAHRYSVPRQQYPPQEWLARYNQRTYTDSLSPPCPELTLGFTLGVVPPVGLDKCTVTYHEEYSVLCALPVHPSMRPSPHPILWQPLIFYFLIILPFPESHIIEIIHCMQPLGSRFFHLAKCIQDLLSVNGSVVGFIPGIPLYPYPVVCLSIDLGVHHSFQFWRVMNEVTINIYRS